MTPPELRLMKEFTLEETMRIESRARATPLGLYRIKVKVEIHLVEEEE